MPKQLLILGSHYAKPNRIDVFSLGERVAAGTAPGKRSCVRNKMDGNEDSIGITEMADGHLLLLADSHFGGLAGEYAVTRFPGVFESLRGSPGRRLFLSHLALDQAISDYNRAKETSLPSATTLISALVQGATLHLCTSGDSLSLLWRKGQLSYLNDVHPSLFLGNPAGLVWPLRSWLRARVEFRHRPSIQELHEAGFLLSRLGRSADWRGLTADEPVPRIQEIADLLGLATLPARFKKLEPWHPLFRLIAETLPREQSFGLLPGDLIFLASDGLLEDVSGCGMDQLQTLFEAHEASPAVLARAILEAASGRKGGRDNLSVLLFRSGTSTAAPGSCNRGPT